MRNIKLTLEYDGTGFCGWQWQPNGRSVQGTLQDSLRDLLEEKPTIHAAGRTDSGVHALGQVANFKTDSALATRSIDLGLNSYLPEDLIVVQAEEVNEGFHSRFDATGRAYRYVISKRPRAVGRHFSWHCPYELDVDQIEKGSRALVGRHSFRAFCKEIEGEEHYLSNVMKLDWKDDDDAITLTICANRFLHNMIRIIVGTLVEVGRGKMKPEQVTEILESQKRENAGTTAPARGLILEKVYY